MGGKEKILQNFKLKNFFEKI